MKTTVNLGLKKPEGTDVVNIDDFNYNADVIDTELQKRALKTDIPTIPVQSVNGKTGAVTLTSADVGAATSAQGIKADTALQSSQLGKTGGPAKQDDFVSHLTDSMYQTAGGTATAITLTISGQLVTGYPITFIASANNNGAATTINGKPLYKPGTTTAPTLMLGKAYTVWYNSASNCFFIKASAEGTASTAQVLAGVPFSNENETGLIGAMPNRTFAANNNNYTNAVSAKADGAGSLCIVPLEGYYKQETNGAGFGSILAWESNLVASSIISGRSIFGVAGTATVQSLGGRRFASGSFNIPSNMQNYTISGLNFRPSYVLVWYEGMFTVNSNLGTQIKRIVPMAIYNPSCNNYIVAWGDGYGASQHYSYITPNNNGFTISDSQNYWILFNTSYNPYYWIAIE